MRRSIGRYLFGKTTWCSIFLWSRVLCRWHEICRESAEDKSADNARDCGSEDNLRRCPASDIDVTGQKLHQSHGFFSGVQNEKRCQSLLSYVSEYKLKMEVVT